MRSPSQSMRLRALSGNSYVECFTTSVARFVVAALAMVVLTVPTFAQQDRTSLIIEGSVVDSTGAAISDAQVMIASGGRVIVTVNTGNDGSFQIQTPDRQPLTLLVKASGFATH